MNYGEILKLCDYLGSRWGSLPGASEFRDFEEALRQLIREIRSRVNILGLIPVEDALPEVHKKVLAIGWGEAKRHFVYAFAQYREETACKRWVSEGQSQTLWFEPAFWCELPTVPVEELQYAGTTTVEQAKAEAIHSHGSGAPLQLPKNYDPDKIASRIMAYISLQILMGVSK